MEQDATDTHDRLMAAVCETLEQAGAIDALGPALASAELTTLPTRMEPFRQFVSTALLEAIVGLVHPATAGGIVEELLARAERTLGSERGVPTVPPPPAPSDGAAEDYTALATGAVHTRPTPVWGLRRSSDGELAPPAVWLIVSTEPLLLELARAHAPAGTEVVEVKSPSALSGLLSQGGATHLVLDAAAPSIAIDQAVEALVKDGNSARVLLWRMSAAALAEIAEEAPVARTWLRLEDEVTPPEIVQLLGA